MKSKDKYRERTPLHLRFAEGIGCKITQLTWYALVTSVVVSITIGLLKLAGVIN